MRGVFTSVGPVVGGLGGTSCGMGVRTFVRGRKRCFHRVARCARGTSSGRATTGRLTMSFASGICSTCISPGGKGVSDTVRASLGFFVVCCMFPTVLLARRSSTGLVTSRLYDE